MSEKKSTAKNLLYVDCPTCEKKTPWQENRYRPFCSERCKYKDISNWAEGKYKIPSKSIEIDPDEEDENY